MPSPDPNVLVVTVDCLRRDRLSAYGHERKTTPFLDGLLERSLHSSSAHSASGWTCPSIASILTGLYPHRHGGGLVPGEPKNLSKSNLPTKLPPDVPTLADTLAARGYATAAMAAVWNAHLSVPGRFSHMTMLQKPAPKLVRRALDWIRAQEGPFLLWLHLGDAHEPLDVPRHLREVFGPIPRLRKVRRWDYTRSDADIGSEGFRTYREARIRLYDAAVRAADEALRDLWAGLEASGHAERTLAVFTSDHGEEFWEHREEEMAGFSDPRDIYGAGHGHNLFQVHLLVPLLFVGPGIEPRRVDANASSVDIVPTVIHAVGGDAGDVDGRSLLDDRDGPERPILAGGIAYGYEKASVVMGDTKLLVSAGDGYERAFRLGSDRREAGLAGPEEAERLRGHLPQGQENVGEQVEATEEIVGHLRDLGYIE